MFKPMFALHKDASGNIIAASSFDQDYQLSSWLRDRDFRSGDKLEFHEVALRPEFDEVEPLTPAFIKEPPTAPQTVADDQPF